MAQTKTPIINTQLDTLNANVTAANTAITDGNTKLETGLNAANTNLDAIGDNVAAVGTKLDTANTQLTAANAKLGTTNTNLESIATQEQTANAKRDTANTNLANMVAQETAANTKRDTANTKLEAISGKIADSGTQLETLNENLLAIGEKFDTMNDMFGLMIGRDLTDPVDLADIGRIVRAGQAKKVFSIGDQIIVPWKDTATTTEYSMPFDIVHFKDVTLQDGEVVPGMILQSHYCTPFGVQFDACEALYVPTAEMAAGTYYFTIGDNWGSHLYVKGTTIQFTLTNAVPAGGQLVLTQGTVDQTSISSFKLSTYASPASLTAIETVQCSIGSSGTSIGTLSASTKYSTSGINQMHRCNYGYNRWSQSGIRQWLNSKADKGKWWTSQNPFDRAPGELSSKNGFMSGFSEDFLSLLKPIKVTTALNAVSDTAIGTTEDTYDTFFLPSKRNMNLIEELSGVEGDIWDYWYRATNGVKPVNYKDGAAPITYALENHNSAQNVRLRSANRGHASNTWNVSASGGVINLNATWSPRSAPACAIC